MSPDWSVISLGESATWYSGGTPSKANPDFWKNGTVPWISAKSLRDFFIDSSDEKVTDSAIGKGTRLVPKDTILFVVRGMSLKTEFRIGITRKAVTFNQDLKALIPKQGFLPSFLAYALRAKAPEILSLVEEAGHGTGVLPTSVMQSLDIPLPPQNEQKAIAHILGSLDDKIELNRKMNTTLEAMAQALFKSWFVDFDPVVDNALAAGNPIPDALKDKAAARAALGDARKPLPEDVAGLFPAGFVWTEEMGWIPDGWEVRSLDQIANYLNGLALQKFRPDSDSEYLPIVKIAQLKAGEATHEEKASKNVKPEYVIDNGDVIFSWSGSLVVDIWTGGKAALNQHLFKVTSDGFPKWFYFAYTKHHLEEFQRIAAAKAVTMGHIKRSHLKEAKCIIPSTVLINAATKHHQHLIDQMINIRVSSRTLSQLRDVLLPKLLSGELRIPDAEKLIKEAGV